MLTPSDAYWARRAEARMEQYLRDSEQTARILGRAYERALADIEDDMQRIFFRFAERVGVGMDDAVQLLSRTATRREYEGLLDLIAQTSDPAEKARLMFLADAPGYRYRISRLDALRNNVRARLASLGSFEARTDTAAFSATITDAYGRSMFDLQRGTGLGFSFSQMGTGAVQEILRNPWSGQAFSQRIWKNSDALTDFMNQELTAGFASGQSINTISNRLADTMGSGYRAAERLVRTETSYMANAAEKASYQEAGIEEYKFLATLDGRTSEVCQDLDGEVFKVAEAVPGKNYPPMHPYCRSTTVTVLDGEVMERLQRRAKDPVTGESILVPADMTYKEWKESLVGKYGKSQVSSIDKMIKYASADAELRKQYEERLGRVAPKDLDTFQSIKYRDDEKWGVLQAQYRAMGYYEKALQAEPEITRVVSEVANEVGLDQVGLEFRIKSKGSYLRKVAANYKPDGTEYEVKDILRYTYTAGPQDLARKTNAAIVAFDIRGYNTYEVKNTWLKPNVAYRGINTSLRAPNGQAFEMQYHTPESFELKNGKLHELYEEARVLDPRSEDFLRLQDEMIELSSKLTVPEGIEEVKSR